MKTILVTGSNGQLGKAFKKLENQFSDFHWIFADRKELDITSESKIAVFFESFQPHFVLNCAAYTAVNQAEKEPDLAFLVNEHAVRNLALACSDRDVDFIHFSTDYVYDGNQNTPYTEEDYCTPRSVYGRSKLAGERAAFAKHPYSIVIRTSWLYSNIGQNFYLTMRGLGEKLEEIKVVDDQIGSPTLADDLAEGTMSIINQLIQKNQEIRGQTINFSNQGVCSWYDFAHAILQMTGFTGKVLPVSTDEFPRPAPRPSFSLMSKRKYSTLIPHEIPHWRDSLKKCIDNG